MLNIEDVCDFSKSHACTVHVMSRVDFLQCIVRRTNVTDRQTDYRLIPVHLIVLVRNFYDTMMCDYDVQDPICKKSYDKLKKNLGFKV